MFWYVRHGFDWYQKHPDIISWNKEMASQSNNGKAFRSVKKNDKVVYFSHESPRGMIGLFNVEADCSVKAIEGKTASFFCPISPLYLPNGGKPVKSVAKSVVGKCLKPMGTIFQLSTDEYRKIKAHVLGMDEPTNHRELEDLFSKVHSYIGFQRIVRHQIPYPDAVALDSSGKEQRIEFEFDSDSFRKEGHDPKGCDLIICWKDGLGIDRPKKLRLIELKSLYGSG